MAVLELVVLLQQLFGEAVVCLEHPCSLCGLGILGDVRHIGIQD
jgi:hypothetical protein